MFLRLLFFIALLSCSTGLTARAQSVAETDYTTTEILSEHEAFAPGETLWFAVRQDVRDGWHVFWTNPGDAGIPLHLQWSLPAGYEAGAILHPAPEFIPVGPLASYAHEGAPVFLTSVTAPESAAPGDRVRIVIDAAWQACEQICVPEDAQLSFELPVVDKPALNAEARAVFEAARAALPAPHNGEATFARVGGVYRLQLSPWGEQTIDDAFFFPVIEGLTTPAAPQQADVLDNTLTIEMTPGWAEALSSPAITGVLTYGAEGTRKAISVTARVNGSLAPLVDGAPLSAAAGDANIAWYFLLAFLGGVILNIMPCVFPIIFVKASSFMESAHHNPGAMRAHGLVFTAGVLATFALMGGVLLALRAGGEQLGWGFHLQSPIVVALSAYVLFMVGLNLAGLFTVGEGLAGAGDSLTRKRGAVGAFFTGALAVVVAAPCIGPLLTAPMGAALMQPPVVGMTIFLLMGLGLAAPYLVLSFAPAAGGLLPRPGPWMSLLKQAMAFPVFAAAAYFLWVFSNQTGSVGLAFVLSGAVLLALAGWLFENSKGEGAWALAARAASALALVFAVAPVMRIEATQAASTTAASAYGATSAVPYDADRLAQYRADGAPVFIDFTAAWCVTCQFNKLTVLKSTAVEEAFAESGTVLMVADWTVRDPEITQALESYGASGVPLYVVYPAGGANARILPLPLSKKDVVDALRQAG